MLNSRFTRLPWMGTLLAALLAASFAFAAGPPAGDCADCPTAKKVMGLLTEWEGAAKQAASMSDQDRARLTSKMQSCKEQCPVGSRLGDTVTAVRDVLADAIAAAEANAKHCPLETAKAGGASCEEALAMKTMRGQALHGLHQLASYTAGAVTGCCESSGAVKTSLAAKSDSCEKGTTCPIQTASRLGMLRASWKTAKQEAVAMPAARKQALLTSMGSLGQEVKAVTLVPASVLTLAEGLGKLNELNAQMGEWAQAHAELLADVPPSAMQSFQLHNALIDQARELLQGVTETMTALHGDSLAVSN